ncbi:hypothetical protein ANN_17668 [Periplaneta americana]|uniref:Reverse transcriptase domain-containing protein n=1 Tax=Periplaneta americana TaxID=6978 RepID=A0ABQ8SUJ1_PERAM|nr:hypothetical protein ANN_17668 [Periplaneta americana]
MSADRDCDPQIQDDPSTSLKMSDADTDSIDDDSGYFDDSDADPDFVMNDRDASTDTDFDNDIADNNQLLENESNVNCTIENSFYDGRIVGKRAVWLQGGKRYERCNWTATTISERYLEKNKEVYVVFVDLEKAFDRVDWNKLMGILKKIDVDWKERRLFNVVSRRGDDTKRYATGANDSCEQKINANKTKIMVIGRNIQKINLRILNEAVEQVDNFKYLGCTISSNMSCCHEIKRRIAMAKGAFNRKKSIFSGPLEKN